MKASRPIFFAVALSHTLLCAADEPFHLSASITRDDVFIGQFDVEIPAGGEVTVMTKNGLQLQIQASDDLTDPVQSTMRLIDVSKGEPKVLHTSKSPDPTSAPRAVAFTICDGAVTMSNPAHEVRPTCAALAASRARELRK